MVDKSIDFSDNGDARFGEDKNGNPFIEHKRSGERVYVDGDGLQTEGVSVRKGQSVFGTSNVAQSISGSGDLSSESSFGRLPTQWDDEGVIYSDNTLDQMIFPSIFHAGRYLKNPLAEYYLYYSEYRTAGQRGLRLATSDNIESGWTEYGSNPLFDLSIHSEIGDHISSCYPIWDPFENQLEVYFHNAGDKSYGQWTALAVSDDGLNFRYGGEVLSTPPRGRSRWDNNTRTYLRVYREQGMRWGLYMGSNKGINKAEGASIGFCWSYDGGEWFVEHKPLFQARNPNHQAAPNYVRASAMKINGQIYLIVANERDGTIDIGPLYGVSQPQPNFVTTNLPFISDSYNIYHGESKLYLIGQDKNQTHQAHLFSKKWGELI